MAGDRQGSKGSGSALEGTEVGGPARGDNVKAPRVMMAATVRTVSERTQTAPRTLRERRRARTRDGIEGVALELFVEYGYEATTVEQIAEAALISPRTFFRYFSSKEDVVLARGREGMTLAARSLAERPSDEPVIESLRAVVEVVAHLRDSDRERHLAWLRLVTTTPPLAAAFLELLHATERMLREFVATRLGLSPADRLPRLVAAGFGTSFRVAAETWLESDGAEDLMAIVRENLEALVASLLAAAGRASDSPAGGSALRP